LTFDRSPPLQNISAGRAGTRLCPKSQLWRLNCRSQRLEWRHSSSFHDVLSYAPKLAFLHVDTVQLLLLHWACRTSRRAMAEANIDQKHSFLYPLSFRHTSPCCCFGRSTVSTKPNTALQMVCLSDQYPVCLHQTAIVSVTSRL
jgi:hypothetical protein